MALETRLSLGEVTNALAAAFAAMKARVEPVAGPTDPLDHPGGAADIAVVGRRSSFAHRWAVQVYLYDLGGRRGVEFVALGRGGSRRVVPGPRGSTSLATSVRTMEKLVAGLRALDASAQLLG